MATENLKSTPITNLDGSAGVITANTAGEGGPGNLRSVTGVVAFTTGKTLGSTYQALRIPCDCKVKHVYAMLDAAVSTFTGDIGLYYSTSHFDGTAQANVADVVSGTTAPTVVDADFFGSAVALASQVTPLDVTFEANSGYLPSESNTAVWSAAGLSANPGGYFDVVFTNTSTNSGATNLIVEVQFVP